MPTIAQIARVNYKSERVGGMHSESRKAFADTSFLVACDQRQLWADIIRFYLNKKGLGIEVFNNVWNEYTQLYEQRAMDDNGSLKVTRDFDSSVKGITFVGIASISKWYSSLARKAWKTFCTKKDGSKPSETDIMIMAAALHHCLNGGESVVISADHDIIEPLEGILRSCEPDHPLSMEVFSPYKIPDVEEFYQHPRMVIPSSAREKVLNLFPSDAGLNFLAVAEAVELNGHKFDVAVAVYRKTFYASNLPGIEGVGYLPIFDVKERSEKELRKVIRKVRENGKVVVRKRREWCDVLEFKVGSGLYSSARQIEYREVCLHTTDRTIKPFWNPELDCLMAQLEAA